MMLFLFGKLLVAAERSEAALCLLGIGPPGRRCAGIIDGMTNNRRVLLMLGHLPPQQHRRRSVKT